MSSRRRKTGLRLDIQKEANGGTGLSAAGTRSTFASLKQDHQRLQHLYEISKLFASFENVEQTFDPALGIVTKTLPLRSASLIETENGQSKMTAWPSVGQSAEQMQAGKDNVQSVYAYLVGAVSTESLNVSEHAGVSVLPSQADTDGSFGKRFIVIPLVVARRPLFGALQLEVAGAPDKMDLVFVNAIANQLAIALDRDRAWRRDLVRRDHAEEGRTHAEARGMTSERRRVVAEDSSDKFQALATANAALHEQARHAVRVRDQILAVVAHDLKNPISTIVMTTDLLARKVPPDEPVKGGLGQAVGRIQRAAARMLRLIDDLLDFASIEVGRLSVRPVLQDPSSILRETLAIFEGAANEHGVQLTVYVEEHLPKACCDRDRILQVLANLVGNATKIMTDGGTIDLRAEVRGHDILFSVVDSGPGIAEEDVKHLFEPYWRSGEAQYKGTGLGLAIANGIIKAHDGRLWVESELGRGASFFFTIPATAADDERPVASPC